MTLTTNIDGKNVVVAIDGKVDTTTAPELEAELAKIAPEAELLVLDFEKVIYLSSAGLRALLNTQKALAGHGKLVIRNVNDVVMDVFDMTGFSSILTIE